MTKAAPQKTETPTPDKLVEGALVAEAPAPEASAPASNPFTKEIGKRAWIVAVHGDMVNLHTNERFTSDPKKAKIDEFIASQLEAGKMALHVEEE